MQRRLFCFLVLLLAATGSLLAQGVEYIRANYTKYEYEIPMRDGQKLFTYDTIDWMVKNVPNNNGRVGMWGISYPGFYTAAGIIDAHPALKAASPQAPLGDYYMGDDSLPKTSASRPLAPTFWSIKPNRSPAIGLSPVPLPQPCTCRRRAPIQTSSSS